MFNSILNGLLYLTGWPLALILIFGGLYFTFRTKFIQLRLFRETFRVIFEKPKNAGHVSSFGALMISTASRVGTGNIIGVSTAICLGGMGAVFWMWLTAFIGGAAAFVESTLAQIYKRKNPNGGSYGGPSFYIESACHNKFLAILFALALIFTYGVGYNMLASYNLQSCFACFHFYESPLLLNYVFGDGQENAFTLSMRISWCWVFGLCTAALFFFTIMGGSRRLVKATGIMVPVMGLLYIVLTIFTLCINVKFIPEMIVSIFRSAFDFKAIFGGFAGSVLMWGLKRGLYSNEAGIGSAPNAAAAAAVSHPVKQGLVQMLSVFIDTNLLCTATALMCLSSGITPTAEMAGAPFVQAAMESTFGMNGPIFIAVAMVLFAFTTLLGNFYYVESCFAYILGRTPSYMTLLIVRLTGTLLIFLGASMKMSLAWDIADIAQCILAFINIPVCIVIGGVAYKALDHYIAQRKKGLNPEFKAEEIQLQHPTDFWRD